MCFDLRRIGHQGHARWARGGPGLGSYSPYLGARFASLVRTRQVSAALAFVRKASTTRRVNLSHIVGHGGRFLLPPSLQGVARRFVGRELTPSWMNASSVSSVDTPVSPDPAVRGADVLRMSLRDAVEHNLPHLLRYRTRNSMAWSIESGVPFLTPEMVGLCLSLPRAFPISEAGESKSVFRAAMKDIVPPRGALPPGQGRLHRARSSVAD